MIFVFVLVTLVVFLNIFGKTENMILPSDYGKENVEYQFIGDEPYIYNASGCVYWKDYPGTELLVNSEEDFNNTEIVSLGSDQYKFEFFEYYQDDNRGDIVTSYKIYKNGVQIDEFNGTLRELFDLEKCSRTFFDDGCYYKFENEAGVLDVHLIHLRESTTSGGRCPDTYYATNRYEIIPSGTTEDPDNPPIPSEDTDKPTFNVLWVLIPILALIFIISIYFIVMRMK